MAIKPKTAAEKSILLIMKIEAISPISGIIGTLPILPGILKMRSCFGFEKRRIMTARFTIKNIAKIAKVVTKATCLRPPERTKSIAIIDVTAIATNGVFVLLCTLEIMPGRLWSAAIPYKSLDTATRIIRIVLAVANNAIKEKIAEPSGPSTVLATREIGAAVAASSCQGTMLIALIETRT